MSVDQVLKLSLLVFLAICAAILFDELPMDEAVVKNAQDQETMTHSCVKPAGVNFGLKRLFICLTDNDAEA